MFVLKIQLISGWYEQVLVAQVDWRAPSLLLLQGDLGFLGIRSVGSSCAVHSSASRSAWYALFNPMWWIQRVRLATLTAVGLLRKTGYGPSPRGAKESCFQPLTTPNPRAQIRESVPQGVMEHLLYKHRYVIYYLTHLLWNLISPYLRQICWHLFYNGRGPPIHNFIRRRALGPLGHPVFEQLRWKQVPQEQSVSKIHLERVSLRVRLAPSTIPELWGLYAVCNFPLMLKVLLTCYTKSATKAPPLSRPLLVGNPNLGTHSLSRH